MHSRGSIKQQNSSLGIKGGGPQSRSLHKTWLQRRTTLFVMLLIIVATCILASGYISSPTSHTRAVGRLANNALVARVLQGDSSISKIYEPRNVRGERDSDKEDLHHMNSKENENERPPQLQDSRKTESEHSGADIDVGHAAFLSLFFPQFSRSSRLKKNQTKPTVIDFQDHSLALKNEASRLNARDFEYLIDYRRMVKEKRQSRLNNLDNEHPTAKNDFDGTHPDDQYLQVFLPTALAELQPLMRYCSEHESENIVNCRNTRLESLTQYVTAMSKEVSSPVLLYGSKGKALVPAYYFYDYPDCTGVDSVRLTRVLKYGSKTGIFLGQGLVEDQASNDSSRTAHGNSYLQAEVVLKQFNVLQFSRFYGYHTFMAATFGGVMSIQRSPAINYPTRSCVVQKGARILYGVEESDSFPLLNTSVSSLKMKELEGGLTDTVIQHQPLMMGTTLQSFLKARRYFLDDKTIEKGKKTKLYQRDALDIAVQIVCIFDFLHNHPYGPFSYDDNHPEQYMIEMVLRPDHHSGQDEQHDHDFFPRVTLIDIDTLQRGEYPENVEGYNDISDIKEDELIKLDLDTLEPWRIRFEVANLVGSEQITAPVTKKNKSDVDAQNRNASQGFFVLEVYPQLCPIGSRRLLDLVQTHHYFDGNRFFRVITGFVVQWGVSSNRQQTLEWDRMNIQDESADLMANFTRSIKENTAWFPPLFSSSGSPEPYRNEHTHPVKNMRGTLSYGMRGPNSRTCQVFINTANNGFLDSLNFVPFARVIDGGIYAGKGNITRKYSDGLEAGMTVIDQLNSKYGDDRDLGSKYMGRGEPYLVEKYPDLSYIVSARIVPAEELVAEKTKRDLFSGSDSELDGVAQAFSEYSLMLTDQDVHKFNTQQIGAKNGSYVKKMHWNIEDALVQCRCFYCDGRGDCVMLNTLDGYNFCGQADGTADNTMSTSPEYERLMAAKMRIFAGNGSKRQLTDLKQCTAVSQDMWMVGQLLMMIAGGGTNGPWPRKGPHKVPLPEVINRLKSGMVPDLSRNGGKDEKHRNFVELADVAAGMMQAVLRQQRWFRGNSSLGNSKGPRPQLMKDVLQDLWKLCRSLKPEPTCRYIDSCPALLPAK